MKPVDNLLTLTANIYLFFYTLSMCAKANLVKYKIGNFEMMRQTLRFNFNFISLPPNHLQYITRLVVMKFFLSDYLYI